MNIREHVPAVVLLAWALIVATVGMSQPIAIVALFSIVAALKVQIDESRRQRATRQHLRRRR